MKKVFNITNKYIVIAIPLILFTLFSIIYMAVSATGKLINMLFAVILFTLMSGAFFAGWFNMIKLAVVRNTDDEPNSLIKEFPSGVGEYFLSSLGGIFTSLLFMLTISLGTYYIGIKTIGDPGISAESFSKAIENTAALKAFLASLSPEQLIQLNHWNLLLLGTMTLTYFLLILYLPAIFFKSKDPFKAFLISLKDLFSKHFLKTLGIYLLIFTVNFFISILTALLGGNATTSFLLTIINFYFLCVIAVGVFYYYYNTFILPQLGQNIDTCV